MALHMEKRERWSYTCRKRENISLRIVLFVNKWFSVWYTLFILFWLYVIKQLQNSQRGAEMGKDEAQMAYNEALKAKNQTEYARTALQDLFVRISGFLSADGATPNDIKSVSQHWQHLLFSARFCFLWFLKLHIFIWIYFFFDVFKKNLYKLLNNWKELRFYLNYVYCMCFHCLKNNKCLLFHWFHQVCLSMFTWVKLDIYEPHKLALSFLTKN